MKLRDYQIAAKESTLKAWADGFRCVAGRMFTGGGKTVVFADIIKSRLPLRAIVLAHRSELVMQARDKIEKVAGLHVGIEMGELKSSSENGLFHSRDQVIVSTIQTQITGGDGSGRIGKFDPMDFGTLIIDECHRAISPAYQKAIRYYMTNPNLVVLGVTATPDRADEKALGQVFECVPDGFDYDINYGRENGWLAEIEQLSVHIEDLDFTKVRANSEDLNNTDLSAVMTSEKPLYGIADACIQLAGNKRGIGFSPSVAHAEMTSNIFNRYKPGMSAFISGKTDKDVRKQINKDFKNGKIQWIWNCGTHTEGFDDAGVEFVVPKPTKSRALHEQMIGRGTRPSESIANTLGDQAIAALRRAMVRRSDKPVVTVLDFYGNSGKHKLITTFDILGGDMTPESVKAAVEFSRQAGKPVRVVATLQEQEKRQQEAKARLEEEEAKKSKVVAKATFKTTKVDPFNVLDIRPVVERGWDQGKSLSEKQRKVLKSAGYDPDKMEFGRGKQLVGIIISRRENKKCSIAQASLLERCGWSKKEASDMGFDQAKTALDAAVKNGYRKPSNFKTIPPIPARARASQMNPMTAPYSSDNFDDVPF